MSIKYIVNVTILNLFSASASRFLHQLFTSLCPPPTSGGAIVTTCRHPRDSGSETRNPGAVGKALFPVCCAHPQASLAPMAESEQHPLQRSLGLFFFFFEKGEGENGNKLAKSVGGRGEDPTRHATPQEACIDSCHGCTGTALSSSCKEFQVLGVLRAPEVSDPSSHCLYQLRREVLPKVMK